MPRAFSLYRHLLTYQIYGANTDVGKTVFSTILCKAFTRKKKTWYLKPVSTGPLEEADNYHVSSFVPQANTSCLFQFGEAVSPHLAAAKTRNLNPVFISSPLYYTSFSNDLVATFR
jgi:bifunctional dethiobiotin synthetase / adenosylmethionine---8-amino-7-oxononanoate aminotransferase